MEININPEKLALMFEDALNGGFNIEKISNLAFNIYQEDGLRLTKDMDSIILMLMAMLEGPEFELTESEFLEIINKIRTM